MSERSEELMGKDERVIVLALLLLRCPLLERLDWFLLE